MARLVEQARNALGQGPGQGPGPGQKTTPKDMTIRDGEKAEKDGKKGKGKDEQSHKQPNNASGKQEKKIDQGTTTKSSKRAKTTSSHHRDNNDDNDNGDCFAAGEGPGLDGGDDGDDALPVGEYVLEGGGDETGAKSNNKKKKNKAKQQQGKDAKDFGVGRR